jgi:hypothetical protein
MYACVAGGMGVRFRTRASVLSLLVSIPPLEPEMSGGCPSRLHVTIVTYTLSPNIRSYQPFYRANTLDMLSETCYARARGSFPSRACVSVPLRVPVESVLVSDVSTRKGKAMTNELDIRTVTVSIGRGTAEGPMSATQWRRFRRSVQTSVRTCARFGDDGRAVVHVDDAKATGEWKGEPEESRTWVAEVHRRDVLLLQDYMSIHVDHYGQDCIAVTVGETTLVR